MARMPGARWVGEHGSRPMVKYDIVCVHTIVGWAPAHAAHFSVKLNGEILQSRDTRYRSAANLDGNYRVIAIENEDGGQWQKPLTDAQVEANARILAWANKEHGVPLKMCPNSRPGSRGLAYHRQGVDGNFSDHRFPGRVPGGEIWSSSRGKVCPGDNKIAQLPAILAAARNDGGLDMDEATIRKIIREELDKFVVDLADEIKIDVGKKHKWSLDTVIRTMFNRQARRDG